MAGWRCSPRSSRTARDDRRDPAGARSPIPAPPVARHRLVGAKVRAARLLQQVGADRREVAKLRRRRLVDRLAEHRPAAATTSSAATSLRRASAPIRRPPPGSSLDPVEAGDARDVDDPVGSGDTEPQPVEQLGAAGEHRGPGLARRFQPRRATLRRARRRTGASARRGVVLGGRRGLDGLDDLRVGAAAADVAAHPLADLVLVGGVALARCRPRRRSPGRGCRTHTGTRRGR